MFIIQLLENIYRITTNREKYSTGDRTTHYSRIRVVVIGFKQTLF